MSGIFDIEAAARQARLDELARAAPPREQWWNDIHQDEGDYFKVDAMWRYAWAEAMLAESEKRARAAQEKPK